jgi:hypothetical protein
MYGVGAAVTGVATSLDKATVFKIVDQANHGVAVDGHGVGELLLGLPVTYS